MPFAITSMLKAFFSASVPHVSLAAVFLGAATFLGMCAMTQHASAAENAKVLRHVVLFSFKETSSEADIAKIVEAFRGLPGKIPQIKDFEWGTDISPEGKAKGFTHCFFVTFASEADRDAYLPHPAHQDFVSIVGPHVQDVCVVDYWAKP
jgi:hypothetical protein